LLWQSAVVFYFLCSFFAFADIFPWLEWYGSKVEGAQIYDGVYGVISDWDVNLSPWLRKIYVDFFGASIRKVSNDYGIGSFNYLKENKISLLSKLETEKIGFITYAFINGLWISLDTANIYRYLTSLELKVGDYKGNEKFPVEGWILNNKPTIIIKDMSLINIEYEFYTGLWKSINRNIIFSLSLNAKKNLYMSYDKDILPFFYYGVNEIFAKDYFYFSLGCDYVFKQIFNYTNINDKGEEEDFLVYPTIGLVYRIGGYTNTYSFCWLDHTLELRSFILPFKNGKMNVPVSMSLIFSVNNPQWNDYTFSTLVNVGLGYYQY
ncbi:hypothetical protein, partial [Treponema sp. J25]|uniref:hypothetical protein n=1 Tax=Treponema sp. J25 TaxID=2094121 RepID=UPI0010DFD166